jgi:hypothetical protein
MIISFLVLTPQTVLAGEDDCLSVRDYGKHLYDHVIYQSHFDIMPICTYPDGSVLIACGTMIDRGECVCGKEGQMFKVLYFDILDPGMA